MAAKSAQEGGVKLSELYAATKTISIEYAGCELKITYKTGFWTCKQERLYFDGGESFSIKNARIIAEHVTAWNITKDDGGPLPITLEVIEGLDVWLTNLIVDAMIRGVNPNPPSSQD